MPSGKKRKRAKISTHKRKKRSRANRHKTKKLFISVVLKNQKSSLKMKLVNSIWLINFDGFFSLSEKSKPVIKYCLIHLSYNV